MIPGKCWLGHSSSRQVLACCGDGQRLRGQTAGQAKPHGKGGDRGGEKGEI